jgi:bacterial/archaeal transporter family protein
VGLGWQGWALLSAVFAAATALLAKAGIEGISSDMATLVRTLVVVPALAALLALTGGWQPLGSLPAKSWILLSLSGLATGASWLCYFRALSLGDAGLVAPIDKLSVVLVAIFGALLLGERLAPRQWLGVGLIAVGSVLVALRR